MSPPTRSGVPSQGRPGRDTGNVCRPAETMAAAGAVVGNDSGLSHVAGAVGTPTLILFGPTPHVTLGQFPENVRVLRAGLWCEPCWFGKKFQACGKRIECLAQIRVERVEDVLREMMGLRKTGATMDA